MLPAVPARPAVRPREEDSPERRSKRARRPVRARPPATSAEEERRLRAAIALSHRVQKLEPVRCPECPVFTPTVEEFRDPMAYIRKIAPVGRQHGIAKIVPPRGWNMQCGLSYEMSRRPLSTRVQHVHDLQNAEIFDDGEDYTLREYKMKADEFAAGYPALRFTGSSTPSPPEYWSRPRSTRGLGSPSPCLRMAAAVEDKYWRIVETPGEPVVVEYANDQDVRVNGSGFPQPTPKDEAAAGDPAAVPVQFDEPKYYRRTGWNLSILPGAKGSLLEHMKEKVGGVNVPWLYVGMLFASFAWHTEDNYLYSINYMHFGTAKTWYGIPDGSAKAFERTVRRCLPDKFAKEPDRIHKLTTVFSPGTVMKHGIPVFHTVQEPGEFIVTFPRGYHSGFSHGFNIAEACNFALPDWVPMGRLAIRHYEKVARETCFSHDEIVIRAARRCELLDSEACAHLAKDLRIIAAEARQDRDTFLALPGVRAHQIVPMTVDAQRYNCVESNRICFVSAVVCESEACREQAQEARAEAKEKAEEEAAALLAKGVPQRELAELVEPDPDHAVVRPRFADDLCDCPLSQRRMVVWYNSADLELLAQRLDERRRALDRATSTVIAIRGRRSASSSASPSFDSAAASASASASAASSSAPSRGLSLASSVQETPLRAHAASGSDSPLTAMSSAPAAGAACDHLDI